jgi:AcrR family transcriptional regulator
MPKPTFFNLPAEKRENLLAIAIAEFAANDYTAASVSKIVERAGVAKGSIYQYFTDKQDLFIYLVEYAAQTLLAGLNQVAPAVEGENFFDTLRRLMSASVRVNAAHPQLSLILRRSTQAPAALRADIDPQLASFMLGAMLSELGYFISATLGIDPQNIVTADVGVFDSPQVEQIFAQVISVLRTGFAK